MSTFTCMGCDVVLSDNARVAEVQELFAARDRRCSRFHPTSELNRVNATPFGVTLVSEELASMIDLAIDAARATGGLVTPAAGGALLAAGYDRDFASMPVDGAAVEPARVPSLDAISLRGRMLLRAEPVVLDLNGVVKGRTVDDALALIGDGWVSAGGDLATTSSVVVGLPGGDTVTVHRGGLATSSTARRAWQRGAEPQHHLIDPATGRPARTPWRDVTVAAQNCVAADVAAKAALLLGRAGPSWLDRRGLAGRFVAADGAVHLNESWRQATVEPRRRAA
jgi:thiamine biosynthesis lipoprotein